MLKYKYASVVFSEIPSEITLAISITGCTIRCNGCHSRELWEDTGTPLTGQELDRLLDENKGVTTVLLLGGEHDIDYLAKLFFWIYSKGIAQPKTAWYCGLDFISKDKEYILQYLDYLKLGHYDPELGGLDSPTTNQRLYSIEHQGDGNYWTNDITYKFWRNANIRTNKETSEILKG